LGYPGASFAGSVPNRNRFLSNLDRRLSDGDLPPHHFLWFSDKALTNLLQASGFEKISIVRTGALSYRQITAKLTRAISRKIGTSAESWSWKNIWIAGIAPMLALVPWMGLRISPSHLYFQCRIPASLGG